MSSPANTEFEAFYRASYGFVLEKARKMLRDQADAVEVAQEVYLRAHAHWTEVRGHPSRIGWLLTATARLSIDRLRRRRNTSDLELDLITDPREAIDGRIFVRALLAEATELTRLIVAHVYLDGMTQDEAATVLQISRKTVQRHLDKFKEGAARHV